MLREVYNFFKTKLSVNEKMLSDKQKKIASAAPPEDKITGADFADLYEKNNLKAWISRPFFVYLN